MDAWLKLTSASYKNRGTPGGRTSGSILGPQDPALITPGSLSPGAGYGFQSGQNILALGPARNSAVFTTGDLTAFSTNQPNQAHQPPDHNIQAQVTWHGPGVDVKYIGGYRDYFYDLRTDYDNTALLAYTIPLNATAVCRFVAGCQPLRFSPNVIFEYIEDKSFWSNEVNISSTYDSPLQWIVGAYEYQETYHQPVIITEPDVPQLATPSAAPANPQRIIYYTDQNMRTRTQAAFGQVDWKVTEALKITAGLRYTFDKKKGYEQGRLFCYGCSAAVDPRNLGALTPVLDITSGTFNGGPPAGFAGVQKGVTAPAVTDPVTGIRRRGLGDTWDAWTGTLGAEWSPDADTLVYAKYSRGYKAGGFNSGTLAGLPETDSEHVDAYEIGAKKDWGTTLRTNVSAFWYDYQDAQVPVSTQPTAGPLTTIFYNIPKIRNMGVELETIWSPIEDLQILFNYSYLDAKIREGCCIQDTADPAATAPGAKPVAGTAGLQDVSGNHMPVSPRNKVSLNANYTWRLGIGNVNASGSYVWRDKVYSSIFDRPYYLADARGQVDARVTWTDTDDRYRVILYGKNLTDEQDYDTLTATRQSTGALNETYVLIPPRTYGVELQYRF